MMNKEQAREIYQRIQKYAYEARVRKTFSFSDDEDYQPMTAGTRAAWLQAVKLNQANLLRAGKKYIKQLAKEEGPLKGPSRAQRERLARIAAAAAAPKAPPAPPPPLKKRKQPRLSKAEREALAYWDELFAIMKLGDVQKGMDRMARLARKDLRSGSATIWKELDRLDWDQAVEKVSDWTRSMLKDLTKASHVDLLEFRTGEAPEILEITGFALKNGRAWLPHLLQKLEQRPLDESYYEMLRERDMKVFLYQRTRSLPGGIGKLLNDFEDDDPRINFYAAATLWDALSRMGIARALRSKSLDFGRILGERQCIPMVLGGEEGEFIGCLTPQGWDTRRG